MFGQKAVLFIGLLFFCLNPFRAFSSPAYKDTTRSACQQHASRLLDEAVSLMEKHYYKKSAVNWDSIYRAAREKIAEADNCQDIYDVIDWCFKQFDEPHSFIMPPSKAAVYNYDTAHLAIKPSLHQLVGEIKSAVLEGNIGYISVPWVRTTDSATCELIADSLQQLIAHIDSQGISKWIIDLRKNSGGNCWPMLAGLGPLLGEGICGYFVSPSDKVAISYRNGAACHGPYIRCQAPHPYTPKETNRQIVLLTGPHTSSSGELVALAFSGKEKVMLYGEPTAGFTTANTTYTLSDHSMLVLTICREADRNGKVCEGKIVPGEIISPNTANRNDDPVKMAAIMWLQSL